MTAPTTAVRPTREHVEALAFAATSTAHARGVAALSVPLNRDLQDDVAYQATVKADEAAREALRAILDATFAELEQLRAEAGR